MPDYDIRIHGDSSRRLRDGYNSSEISVLQTMQTERTLAGPMTRSPVRIVQRESSRSGINRWVASDFSFGSESKEGVGVFDGRERRRRERQFNRLRRRSLNSVTSPAEQHAEVTSRYEPL